MKIATALALAAGLAGLAACQQTPQANNMADNTVLNEPANVEMTANTMEAAPVGNETNAVDTNAGGDTTANTTTNTY
jgi:hypothetical protein